MPSLGFEPEALAPPASISAWLKPDAVGSKNDPKAPSQSDSIATLIVSPPPLDEPELLCDVPPPLSSSSPPQPTTTPSASMAQNSATHLRFLTSPSPLEMPSIDRRCCRGSRGAALLLPSTTEPCTAVLPQADQAAGREQHDQQEDDRDDRVGPRGH